MEASNTILWIIIAIAALIAQSSSKARKMREKEAKKPSTPEYGEAWPKWDSTQPAAPHPTLPRPAAPQAPRPAAPHPAAPFDVPAPKQRAEAGEEEFDGSAFGPVLRKMKAARKHLRTTADSAASPARESADRQPLRPATATQPVKQPATPPANDENSGIAEEFDLRRAIIYSEILKPKFDE